MSSDAGCSVALRGGGGLVVHFGIEQDHAVDRVEGNTERAESLLSTRDADEEKNANKKCRELMNLEYAQKQLETHFDGILGEDVLRDFSAVRIDYKVCVPEFEK